VTSGSGRSWQGVRRDDLSLSEILYVLQGRRLMVAGIVLVLAGAALLLGLFREPVFTAEAVVSVTPQQRLNDEEARETFVREVQAAVAMQEAMREVMRRGEWERGSEEFTERLDSRFATRNGGAGLLVRFSGPTPEQATRAANAYAELFVKRADKLDERLADGTLVADASLERRATPPEGAGPRPLIYAALAAGAGLLLGGAAALLLEGRANGWRGVRDAELTLRAPVLGTIPDYSPAEGEG